ncbi:MAG: cellulase family glycosylhydrolase [Kiritimatiellae bacterium]|nr:cellulase family glycosylhydrolase [Kiritimatiellia bacterium]
MRDSVTFSVFADLHFAPGGRENGSETRMFHDERLAAHFVETWRRIAERFRGREGIYGYDLVNEPMQTSEAAPGCDFWTLQKRAAEAIREIDPDIPIVVEPIHSASPQGFETLRAVPMKDIYYEVHVYQPFAYTHQGVGDGKPWEKAKWPDPEKGWNKEFLREKLAPVRDFQLRHGARIYVGEFSAVAWAEGAGEYLRDAISLFEEYGWSWTFHAFDEWAGWSVEHEAIGHGMGREFFRESKDNDRKRALLDGLAGRIAHAATRPGPDIRFSDLSGHPLSPSRTSSGTYDLAISGLPAFSEGGALRR